MEVLMFYLLNILLCYMLFALELLCAFTVKFTLERESGKIVDVNAQDEADGILTTLALAVSSSGKVCDTRFFYVVLKRSITSHIENIISIFLFFVWCPLIVL